MNREVDSKSPHQSYMMSAAQTQQTLESKLEALQSHFTWDLKPSRPKLFRLRDKLEDIGTEEGSSWVGHIYNLQGFIHYQLGFNEEAQSFFSRATEAFHQIRNTVSDGPWLVVNYGNLAWMHHHLGEQAKSEEYLSKVQALMKEYPSPSEDELHPEIYAEKAWTLMKFYGDKNQLAADYFQRAIRMQPDRVEWQTSRVLALVNTFKYKDNELGDDILEEMEKAKEHDPENLYIAALYLEACAQRGTDIKEEARELAQKVLRKPVSSYSGFKPLLRLYRKHLSMDEAIKLAEEALERHPDERYLKRCAAICYKRKIFDQWKNYLEKNMVNRAISLSEEVISLYPHSSVKRKICLANIYAQTNSSQDIADQMYAELMESDLEPKGKQMLFNYHAKFLYFFRNNCHKSIEYFMKAAEIPQQSFYREDSIRNLEKIRERNRSQMCREIKDFLVNLQHLEPK